MSPATRIAFALCLYRMMIFLIAPSEKTLSQLPHILRPTDDQMRIAHDITLNFIPFPQLRSSLVRKPADWLTILMLHNFHLNWTGDWGDICGMAKSKPVASYQPLGSNAPIWEFDQSTRSYGPLFDKAIFYDAQSDRRYVGQAFEMHCWTQENWSVSKNILNSWPELEGHITVF